MGTSERCANEAVRVAIMYWLCVSCVMWCAVCGVRYSVDLEFALVTHPSCVLWTDFVHVCSALGDSKFKRWDEELNGLYAVCR